MAEEAERRDDLADVFEIRDDQIDVAAIMAEIRARLRERQPLDVDLDALVFRPGTSAFASVDEEIRYYLEQARAANERLLVGEQLRAQRTRSLDPVRGAFHQLVQYYVDALAQRQRAVNADLLNALAALLHRMAALAEEQEQTIALLRSELERSRAGAAATDPRAAPETRSAGV
jgi:hypothetical protein